MILPLTSLKPENLAWLKAAAEKNGQSVAQFALFTLEETLEAWRLAVLSRHEVKPDGNRLSIDEDQDDAYQSWKLAVSEIRLAGLRAGEYEPSTGDERRYAAEYRRDM